MTYTRASAWNNGGDFSNLDLYWYAKGVRAMQARALNDMTSWWFFAAIHNEILLHPDPGPSPLNWVNLTASPAVPTTPLPAATVSGVYWNQCQHGSWYFLPWHRGYLLALEAQIRADVVALGGPATWALPYWDYFGTNPGPDPAYMIPKAFELAQFEGGPNPLYVAARYGPDVTPPGATRKVYVQTAASTQNPAVATLDCMGATTFQSVGQTAGFGGPVTGFNNPGDTPGSLEMNPHRFVHSNVGGPAGLMSENGTAALDPIFYVHHANIDRLWEVWNLQGNANPTDPKWLKGPSGKRGFRMPMAGAAPWSYTPAQVSRLSQTNYTYEDLQTAPVMAAATAHYVAMSERLSGLGVGEDALKRLKDLPVVTGNQNELVGATEAPLSLTASGGMASIRLDATVRRKVSASLTKATEALSAKAVSFVAPDLLSLHLENIRGSSEAGASVLSVYLNLPDGAKPEDHRELFAGSVALFGMRSASSPDGPHGGAGLHFVLEISKIVDGLHLSKALDTETLSVRIVLNRPIAGETKITIGRISIYREGQ